METLRTEQGGDTATVRLDLGGGPLVGYVSRVGSAQVIVESVDSRVSAAVTVSDLVALPTASGFMVGMIAAVNSPVRGSSPSDGGVLQKTLLELELMPIGTLQSGEEGRSGRFSRGLSVYPHVGGACHLIDRDRLHEFMAILGEEVAPGERLVIGRYMADHEAAVVADGNRMFQRHLALLGSTGAGKSWAVAMMLERASQLGHSNLIVLDLHGEYAPLSGGRNGTEPVARRLRVAGPADARRTDDELLYLPYWLLEREELMTLVLNASDPYAADQVFRFSEHVQTLKEISLADAGREDAITTFTPDSPVPYRLDHLIQMLKKDNTEKIVRHPTNRVDPGPYAGRLTGLISRLEARAVDPRYGFIFNPPEETLDYQWLNDTAVKLLAAGRGEAGIKVIDLSEVPSAIVPIVAGVLARLVYEVQFWIDPAERTPVCLVCDEAHLYLPAREDSGPIHRAALTAFESIAKEGRKYGVALVVVSQRPTDVSRTILSQCNNFLIMRVTNDYDRAIIERLIPEALGPISGILPSLDVGEALAIGDALLLPTRIKFDTPRVRPNSDTQPYWTLWAHQPSSDEAIAAGAEALRNQSRAGPKPEPLAQ